MNGYQVLPCKVSSIRAFIETLHYSHSINGVKISHCFKLLDADQIIGAAIFGQMSTTAWKKFGTAECDVLELRRLVCTDNAPRNTESFFIGTMLRWLKKNTEIKIVVSYADPNFGHTGIIYKASNFKLLGMSGGDKGFRDRESGRIYHSRALRTKYNGDFKPFVKVLRAKRDAGLLDEIVLLPKFCFVYKLRCGPG